MKNIAIIPARGGSKRIHKKNIRSFLGKPIIQYSIEAALNSGLFDEVMVSTDSEEIARIAKSCGAKVPFKRSDANSDGYATLFDVIKEVVGIYSQEQRNFDNICCILATAPFITAAKLLKAYDLLLEKNYASVFPVTKYSYPIRRALQVDPHTQIASMIWPEYLTTRSQDIPDAYHDCGQFYWASTNLIMKYNSFFTPISGVVEFPQLEVQDIDTEEDWELAEVKYKMFRQ